MAEMHPGSWFGDAVEEFKKLPPWGRYAVVAVFIGVGAFGFYEWRKQHASTQSANSAVGGSLLPGGSSSDNATPGSTSVFPNVSSAGTSVPLLPSGVQPLYGPNGNLVGFSPSGTQSSAPGTGTPTPTPTPVPTSTGTTGSSGSSSSGGTKPPTPKPPTPKPPTPTPKPPTPTGGNSHHNTPPPKSSGGTNKTPSVPSPKTYTVQSGDNLSTIAARYGLSWQQLYNANKGTVGSNPNLIYPGQRLTISNGGNAAVPQPQQKQTSTEHGQTVLPNGAVLVY